MPSHQQRVSENYKDLCSRCLLRPNREWDDEASWPAFCNLCTWERYVQMRIVDAVPQSVLDAEQSRLKRASR